MTSILWIDDKKVKTRYNEIDSSLKLHIGKDNYKPELSADKIINFEAISKVRLIILHWGNEDNKQEISRFLKKYINYCLTNNKKLSAIVLYSGDKGHILNKHNEFLAIKLNNANLNVEIVKSLEIIPSDTFTCNLESALKKTKNAIDKDNGERIDPGWFCEKTPDETLISKFSDLKHKIVHILLPLDVNMECIERVNQKNKIEKTIECFEDFLQEQLARGEKFSEKLDDLHRIIRTDISVSSGKGDKKIDTILSVLEAMIEEKPDFEEIFKDNWKKILEYAGIICNNKNPFDGNILESKEKALIKGFLNLLDQKLEVFEKNKKMAENDITDILSHFKNQREYDCDDFHGWFEKLIKTLENLRRDLQQIEILKLSK